MFNQKIFSVIEELQNRSDYEEEHKDELLEKRQNAGNNSQHWEILPFIIEEY